MIQFFDIKTGTIYNGDYPYIHWAEPFSVGVIRYKELFFLSDKKIITVSIPKTDEWNFALYNPGTISEPIDYDNSKFLDIDFYASGHVQLFGQKIKDKYAHQLIIICRSDVEGEFIEDFTIDGQVYKVGAEFWGENESLRINLANQGTELPEIIGRAIYGTDLYEDNPDWVLLNRKFRELLIQHMDVMDNKGSYKSLLNALKWFEYQDLVELREVWKFQTPDGTKYYDHPVDTFITDEAKARMFNSAKSTYFALRSLKRKIVGFEDTTIAVPSDPEPEPPKQFTITVIPGANSSADKSTIMVNEGDTVTVMFSANDGYAFGDSTTIVKTVKNITSDITIKGPDAQKKQNLLEDQITEEIHGTPYIRWYPVHGDVADWGGTIYDSSKSIGTYTTIDVLPLVMYKTPSSASMLAKQIYITAESQEDKRQIWNSIKNKTNEVEWHWSGPAGSKAAFNEPFYEVYDPALEDEHDDKTYMRAIIAAHYFGIRANSTEDVIPGEYKIWCTWRGHKSNEITVVVSTKTTPEELWAEHPEIVEYINTHPVVQPGSKKATARKLLTRSVKSDDVEVIIQTPIYETTKYEHDPLEGEIKTLACKWSEDEMRLKMVLLGNFFETYFMPVHTDLIRSVVEDIHASIIKVQTGTMDDVHEECYTEANDFEFDWSGDTPDNPDDPNNPNGLKSFYLKEIHAYAGTSGEQYAFENAPELLSEQPYELEFVPIIGCTPFHPDNTGTNPANNEQLFNLMRGQLYNGIGAIVTGHFKFDEEIVSGECESNQWGQFVKSSFVADGTKSEFDINFLFPAPGDFKFIFRFVGKSGKVYSKIADVTITNNLVVDLEFYALVAGTDRMIETPNPFTSEPEPKYMFSRTKERNYTLEDSIYNLNDGTTIPATNLWLDSDWCQYAQFIPIRESVDKTFHWQAPYMTKVRKVFFTGVNAEAKYEAYIGSREIKENCWYEKLTNEAGEIQLRYCTKKRDDAMNAEPRSVDYTVIDQDVFFPELHTLMKVKGDVYHGIPIVCRPVLRFANSNEKVNYSNLRTAKNFSWEFYSWGVQRNINEIATSSDDALMSWNYAVRLPRGYYTATFRYRFGNEDVEIKKQTPFRLVNEFKPLTHA